MTRNDFERIQSELKANNHPFKNFLASVDMAYSPYSY